MALNLNLLSLSLNALIQRKNSVIQQNTKKINDLEKDYIQQINQLNMIKQALLTQYQKNMMDQLKQIDVAIQQKLPKNNAHGNTNNNTHKLPTTINGVKRMQIIPTPIKMQPLPLPNLDNITLPALTSDNSSTSSPSTQSPTSSLRDVSPSNTSPSTDTNNNHNHSYSDIPDFTNLTLPNLTCIISSIDSINNINNDNNNSNNHQHFVNGICNNNSSVNINSNTSNIMTHIKPTSDASTTHKNDIIDDKDKIMRDIKDIKNFKEFKDIKIKPDIFNHNSNIKPSIECTLCHQSFDSQKNLKNHINKVHTFTCDLCSKSFQKRIDLKRHQRIHDGVSVYEWYDFVVIHDLLCIYVRTMHQIFSKICFKTYTSAATLNNHMRLHEGMLLINCNYIFMHDILIWEICWF